MRYATVLTTALLLGLGVRADEKPKLPEVPPSIVTATASEKGGEVKVRYTSLVYQTIAEKQKVQVGNVEMETTVYRTVPVFVESQVIINGREAKATRVNGKEIAAKDLPKLLDKGTPVLIVYSDKINEEYRSLYKDDVIVIHMDSTPREPK